MAFNIADYPDIYPLPLQLSWLSSWLMHLPMVPVLVETLRPRTFVELGALAGDSYLAFCQAVAVRGLPTECYAVDTWVGDAQAGYYDDGVYAEVESRNRARYAGFSQLLRMTFDEALPRFADGTIDLLHIDGMHGYEEVKHDFEAWLPKMSPRGVVLFHDVEVRADGFGVWKLWEEISAGRPHFCVPYGHGLGILVTGSEAPRPFLEYLAEMRADPERTLGPLAAIGMRNETISKIVPLARGIYRMQQLAADFRKATGGAVQPVPGLNDIAGNPRQYVDAACLEMMAVIREACQLAAQQRGGPPAGA